MKLLIENDADVNICNTERVTPLHIASMLDNDEPFNTLLELNANPNCADKDGDIPLFTAIQKKMNNKVQKLIDSGANILLKNARQKNALILASCCGNVEAVNILISNDADISDCDNQRNTPLHYAAIHKNNEIIKILLENGADPLIKNAQGKSPFSYATSENVDFFRDSISKKQKQSIAATRRRTIQQPPKSESSSESSSESEEKTVSKEDVKEEESQYEEEEEQKVQKKAVKKSNQEVDKISEAEFEDFKKYVNNELSSMTSEFNEEMNAIMTLVSTLRKALVERKNQK